ncbi:MAG: aminotransferase class V-fold PLP-dependent enzyme [Gemmatimonadetes bacterium]|nr:aminotransferase class V-fold PLP-dependent enzyme [Gemmatimonadota bacterium]
MSPVSRRDFTRLIALGGSSAFISTRAFADQRASLEELGYSAAPMRPAPQQADEKFWTEVRSRFLVPRDLAFINSANLCPTSLPVIEAMERNLRMYEASPSPDVRSGLLRGREDARKLLAEALRVTPEEIVLVRNTTEGNNFVSSGVPLGPGDEVIVWADNHPSNLNAWNVKAKRFGFTVVMVPVPPTHPGTEGYVDLFAKAFTPRTKLMAISHVSSNSGDLLPATELCKLARDRGALSLVDGAQTFGMLDLDLGAMQPDFYTGSMHKWPCGPKEKGMFYVNKAVHDRIQPSVVGVYGGAVGISRQFEAEGQRDDASMAAVVEALNFQGTIGRAAIEKRSRWLATHFMDELGKLNGVKFWTHSDPARRAAIVIFQPGSLDPRKLGAALTAKHKIVATVRAGQDRPGIRLSPHFFNTLEDVDRTVAAIKGYMASGV